MSNSLKTALWVVGLIVVLFIVINVLGGLIQGCRKAKMDEKINQAADMLAP